jgi:hypothetical protein
MKIGSRFEIQLSISTEASNADEPATQA